MRELPSKNTLRSGHHLRKTSVEFKERLKSKGCSPHLDSSSHTEDEIQGKNKSVSKDSRNGAVDGSVLKESFLKEKAASTYSNKFRCQSAQENLKIRKKQSNIIDNGTSKPNGLTLEKPPLVPFHNNKLSPVFHFGVISNERNSAVRKSLRDKLIDKMNDAHYKNSFEEITSPKLRTLDEVKSKLLKNLKENNMNGGSAQEIKCIQDYERGEPIAKNVSIHKRPDTKSAVSKMPVLGVVRNAGSLEK